MFVNLSTGKAKVWVKFDVEPDGRRSTQITFEYADGSARFPAKVRCSKRDNFCRRTGRKMALNKLLWDNPNGKTLCSFTTGFLPSWLNKADRRILWKAVCPEFFKNAPLMSQDVIDMIARVEARRMAEENGGEG